MNYQRQKLGEKIRRFRLLRNLSQDTLAYDCDVHRNYISDIENGVRNISFETLARIAHGMGITVSELTSDLESASPETIFQEKESKDHPS
jgi:transcriptional regulator with XRE-family HTH domain